MHGEEKRTWWVGRDSKGAGEERRGARITMVVVVSGWARKVDDFRESSPHISPHPPSGLTSECRGGMGWDGMWE